jgi:hypothetical protein
LVLVGCGKNPYAPDTTASALNTGYGTVPASVLLNKINFSTEVGTNVTVVASVLDKNGHGVIGALVTWSSDNNSVATVTAGVITPVTVGTATITAKCGEFYATVAVTVTPPLAVFTVYVQGSKPGTFLFSEATTGNPGTIWLHSNDTMLLDQNYQWKSTGVGHTMPTTVGYLFNMTAPVDQDLTVTWTEVYQGSVIYTHTSTLLAGQFSGPVGVPF